MKHFISILLVVVSLCTYGLFAMGSDDDNSNSSTSSSNNYGKGNSYGKYDYHEYNGDNDAMKDANDWLRDNW